MSDPALAAAVTEIVSRVSTRDQQFAAWLAGVATGGPSGDGRYPLTDLLSVSRLVACPAKLAADTNAAIDALTGVLPAAVAARDAAVAARNTAAASQAGAELARDQAVTARNEANTFRQQAASAAADVLTLTNAIAALQADMTRVLQHLGI